MRTPKLTECVKCVLRHIDSLDDESLDNLAAEASRVTDTNCGWQEYRMAWIAKSYANYVLGMRQAKKPGDSDV